MRETVQSSEKVVHPPGTILQHLYLKERARAWRPGAFVEVGVGSGHLSNVLLSLGWSGTGYDLNPSSLERASSVNRAFVDAGRFSVRNVDWLNSDIEPQSVDLVISCMVLEHLDDDQVTRYFAQAARQLRPDGRAVFFVPGSPRHWGLEDEIAGHHRRYTLASLSDTAQRHGWTPMHVVGLTYPVSNLLLKASNALVRRAEADKLELSLQERTEQSGNRDVAWKTNFPGWAGMLLNETALRPAHWLQKRRKAQASPDALVVYAECRPPSPTASPGD